LSGTTKTSGGFYRDEAARLVSEAARAPQRATELARPPSHINEPYIPPVMLEEPMRPPLTPDPAYNENQRSERPRRGESRTGSSRAIAQLVARVMLAPWFVAVAVAAIGIDVMFIKALLGL
jgi:hypothetical protein